MLGEEWHTAEAMCRISDLLYFNGLRDHAIQFWNANNPCPSTESTGTG